jgi:hypothetical protein
MSNGAKAGHVAAHAALGCGMAAAAGGSCRAGGMAAGFSALAGHIPGISGTKLVGRMLIGGVASKLGGGEFANGALSAAFEYLYNNCSADMKSCFSKYELPEIPAGVANAVVGFGDAVGLGIPRMIRNAYDIQGDIDTNSAAYRGGEAAALLAGGARLAYAGAAKGIKYMTNPAALEIEQALFAFTTRNSLKVVFRGGLSTEYRIYEFGVVAQAKTFGEILVSAGKTNIPANTLGISSFFGAILNRQGRQSQ